MGSIHAPSSTALIPQRGGVHFSPIGVHERDGIVVAIRVGIRVVEPGIRPEAHAPASAPRIGADEALELRRVVACAEVYEPDGGVVPVPGVSDILARLAPSRRPIIAVNPSKATRFSRSTDAGHSLFAFLTMPAAQALPRPATGTILAIKAAVTQKQRLTKTS